MKKIILAIAIIQGFLSVHALADSELIDLHSLLGAGVGMSFANAVSADGKTVIGQAIENGSDFLSFYWNADSGVTRLPSLNGSPNAVIATQLSKNGQVIVGQAYDGADSDRFTAFRWTQANGIQSLGFLGDGIKSAASGVNYDGSVVVGLGVRSSGLRGEAFRWTQETGMVGLGTLFADDTLSQATAVSAQGDVVVGASEGANGFTAFRWTEATNMQSLGQLNGGRGSFASSVSADGNTVIGYATDGVSNKKTAMRWTESEGMVGLGLLNDGEESAAASMTQDARIFVGMAKDGLDGPSGSYKAVLWENGQIKLVEDWLTEDGVDLKGMKLSSASDINDDGTVIVGTTSDMHSFIARKSGKDADGNTQKGGAADLENTAISAMNMWQDLALRDDALRGMMGRDCAVFSDKGVCLAVTASYMRTGSDAAWENGMTGLVGSYRLNDNIYLGGWVDNSLTGSTVSSRQSGRWQNPLAGVFGVWKNNSGLSLRSSFAYGQSKIELSRRAGTLVGVESGHGESRTKGMAAEVEVRYQYGDKNWQVSPYVGVGYSKWSQDGYTESDGIAFPLSFGKRDMSASVLTAGAEVSNQITSTIRAGLTVGLEQDLHRNVDPVTAVMPVYGAMTVNAPKPKSLRPLAQVNLDWDLAKNQRIGTALLWQDGGYSSVGDRIGMQAQYSYGF